MKQKRYDEAVLWADALHQELLERPQTNVEHFAIVRVVLANSLAHQNPDDPPRERILCLVDQALKEFRRTSHHEVVTESLALMIRAECMRRSNNIEQEKESMEKSAQLMEELFGKESISSLVPLVYLSAVYARIEGMASEACKHARFVKQNAPTLENGEQHYVAHLAERVLDKFGEN